MQTIHKPVLTKEVLEYLNPKPNENFIDGTIGEGGHTLLILDKNKPEGRVLGIDRDWQQIKNAKIQLKIFGPRAVLINDSYANLREIVKKENFKPVHGIILDLGISSWQLEQSAKGFSFNKDELLDMRYDLQNALTAAKIVNEYSQIQIYDILHNYGEEKFAKQIAKQIIEHRKKDKIQSTFQLKAIIEKTMPSKFRRGNIHFATRAFQAIRIAVNEELENLKKALPQAFSILSSGGRLVLISFHSLEDRIVKQFFNDMAEAKKVKILTKKPITAGWKEISINPRSRSAKLRAIVKI